MSKSMQERTYISCRSCKEHIFRGATVIMLCWKKRKHIKDEKKNPKWSSVSNTRRRVTSVRDINASWVSFWQPSQIGLELNFHGNHFVPPRLLKSSWVSRILAETASCPCMLRTVNLQHSLWLHYNRARGFGLPGE